MEKLSDLDRIQLVEMPRQPIPWHAEPEEVVLTKLQSSLIGLNAQQVAERQVEFGRNILPERKPPSPLDILLHQFKSPLIYILLIAGLIAWLTGDVKDAVFILVVILLNAAIGFFQEWRAAQRAHALQQMLKIQARVRREGQQFWVEAEDLLPGTLCCSSRG